MLESLSIWVMRPLKRQGVGMDLGKGIGFYSYHWGNKKNFPAMPP